MLEINNFTKYRVEKARFSTVAKKVLKGENKGIKNISLAFVEKKEIQKLNKKYRGKNKPTDVLSFSQVEGEKMPNAKDDLGEIVICPDVAKENAKKFGVSQKFEITKIFVHGILHLLGYDHENGKDAEKMEVKEKKYLNN